MKRITFAVLFGAFLIPFMIARVDADQSSATLKSLSMSERIFSAEACLELPSTESWRPQVSWEINGDAMQEIGIMKDHSMVSSKE